MLLSRSSGVMLCNLFTLRRTSSGSVSCRPFLPCSVDGSAVTLWSSSRSADSSRKCCACVSAAPASESHTLVMRASRMCLVMTKPGGTKYCEWPHHVRCARRHEIVTVTLLKAVAPTNDLAIGGGLPLFLL